MAVDGMWTIDFQVPGGRRHADLVFRTDGDVLTGTFDDVELQNGHTDGRNISFFAQLLSPFKVKVKASATIDGDTITGKAKAGIMNIPFTGTRRAS